MQYAIKFLPATVKCFADAPLPEGDALSSLSMLRNERLEFQLAYTVYDSPIHKRTAHLEIDSPLRDYVSVCRVKSVPVSLPCYPFSDQTGYLRTAPGLYPDLLVPFEAQPCWSFIQDSVHSLYFFLENPAGIPAGEYPVTVRAVVEGACVAVAALTVRVIDAALPVTDFVHTQWFHTDCLADYYGVPVFSEAYWTAVENFAAEAVKAGINMLLTPVFTPPLDTDRGGERTTVQLVDVTAENGVYTFGFDKFDRWTDTLDRVGVRYFEISHLFTQWGCANAPKVMAAVNGEYRRIFGWETDAHGPEYRAFLRAFLTALVAHLKARGLDKRCYYHISDEPSLSHLEAYTDAKDMIADILEGYPIIDALSDYDFYRKGVINHPIPATDAISPFLENGVPNLWTYYCCGQGEQVSNRFIAMPGARTRVLGAQLFKYDIAGFLQWGYNFYSCEGSRYPINPYSETCGEHTWPAGDAFSVYPGPGLSPYRSLHGVHLTAALTDLRAFTLCASLIGKEATVALIEQECGGPITFTTSRFTDMQLLAVRERVNAAIAAAL